MPAESPHGVRTPRTCGNLVNLLVAPDACEPDLPETLAVPGLWRPEDLRTPSLCLPELLLAARNFGGEAKRGATPVAQTLLVFQGFCAK